MSHALIPSQIKPNLTLKIISGNEDYNLDMPYKNYHTSLRGTYKERKCIV